MWMPALFLFFHETPRCQRGYSSETNVTTPQALFPWAVSDSQQHRHTTTAPSQTGAQELLQKIFFFNKVKHKNKSLTPVEEQASDDSRYSVWKNYNIAKNPLIPSHSVHTRSNASEQK